MIAMLQIGMKLLTMHLIILFANRQGMTVVTDLEQILLQLKLMAELMAMIV